MFILYQTMHKNYCKFMLNYCDMFRC